MIQQRPDEPGDVGEERHRGRIVRAEDVLRGIDVDQALPGNLQPKAVGAVVRELAAERDHEVAAGDELVERVGASAVEGNDPGMILREDAPGRGRRDDRNAHALDERRELARGAEGSLADVEERPPRLGEPELEVANRNRQRWGRRHRDGPGLAGFVPEIHGNMEDHRPGLAGGAERVGLGQRLFDAIGRADVEHALDERGQDRSLIEGLKLEPPIGHGRRLPQDVEQGSRVEERFGKAGQCVCEPGSGDRDEHARPARGARVSVRHEGRGELVRGDDGAQLRRAQGVEKRDVLRARQAEDGVDREPFEGGAEAFGALHRAALPGSLRAARRARLPR